VFIFFTSQSRVDCCFAMWLLVYISFVPESYVEVKRAHFCGNSRSACWECRVLRAGEWRQKDVGCPFKIVYILDTDAKVHYFSANSEADMKVCAGCV